MPRTHDVNVARLRPLVSPRQLAADLPVTEALAELICNTREAVKAILDGRDRRILVMLGPCSIHDPRAALDYAGRLRRLADEVADRMLLIMRVYFQKPRTTTGWKGLINDPYMNDTFDVPEGLRIARRLLVDLATQEVPAATEFLEPIIPQYITDLVTVASVGARTTESPTHREMASGLSMPVGFKNGTDGSLQTAINAMITSSRPHSFLGIDHYGTSCIVDTKGNPWGHLILRGGRGGPNYGPPHVAEAIEQLRAAGLPARLVIDCSHANSGKDHRNQGEVWHNVIRQRTDGNTSIIGLMLESHLVEGRQDPSSDLASLRYGVSITDACIGWEETRSLVLDGAAELGHAR